MQDYENRFVLCAWAFTSDDIWQSILHDRDYNYPRRRWQVGLLASSLYQLRDEAIVQIQIVHSFMALLNVKTTAMTCHILAKN